MKNTLKSFIQLDAWSKSHELVVDIYGCFQKISRADALKNQIERSSISITSNIAEGFGRESLKDKKHFYVIARGSAYEVQNQLMVARDTDRITNEQFRRLADTSSEALKLLHGLIRSIHNKSQIANS